MQDVVGFLVITLLQIYQGIFQWKIFFKSVKIWQHYGHEFVASLFLAYPVFGMRLKNGRQEQDTTEMQAHIVCIQQHIHPVWSATASHSLRPVTPDFAIIMWMYYLLLAQVACYTAYDVGRLQRAAHKPH